MENIIERCIQYIFNVKNANLGNDIKANNEFKKELLSLIFD